MRTGISWLDFKLGFRMLVKYPGLTLVGGLAMAIAVAIGATFFGITAAFFRSTLPFEDGERLVAIEVWDAESNRPERRILHDLETWHEELESVEGLSAWRSIRRNLIVPGGSAEPVSVAEMGASGFRLAGVSPLLGRTLVEEDERERAPPVGVIGYDVWRTRFRDDSAVLGREVRLGNAVHTVVGVMPDGFGFPVNHGVWIPFRADPSDFEPREGPAVSVFGRLAPGVTLDEAQTELTVVGRRLAAAFPKTHGRLRPRVIPYTSEFLADLPAGEFHVGQIFVILLLVLVCVNIAVLIYARMATRVGEIAVRSALGASRRRIVAQLFGEALVLSAGAAVVGLGVAALILGWLEAEVFGGDGSNLPFWIDFGISPTTVLYVAGLVILGATIMGIVPALKATGRRLQSGLRELSGATMGMRLGGTWTALIVVQVAVAVAVLPAAVFNAWNHLQHGFASPEIAAEAFLTARLMMDRESSSTGEAGASEGSVAARYRDDVGALARRLEAEPGVAEVTFASRALGSELPARIEVEGVPAPGEGPSGHRVRFNHVDVGFFNAFGVPVLAGRGFRYGDTAAAAAPVIVNRAFVEEVLGGRNALGHRLRYVERHRSAGAFPFGEGVEPVRWYEIVGVVGDVLAVGIEPGETRVRLYHPVALGQVHPMSLALRMRDGTPAEFAPRLREIAADVDPDLGVRDILPLDEAIGVYKSLMRRTALAIALVTLSVLLLSAAGIHAMMAFTVARRRKEIGIRAALGSDPRHLLASIFSRALRQLGLGLSLGIGAAILVNDLVENLMGGHEVIVVPAAAALMMVVGLLAALGPARQGLRIQPTEALRADG